MIVETLRSWWDGPARSAIVDLVARVAKAGGADYVPPAERIATFDNDGTLWCERPLPVQVFVLACAGDLHGSSTVDFDGDRAKWQIGLEMTFGK